MTDLLTLYNAKVNQQTSWLFFVVTGADGTSGVGEATLQKLTPQLLSVLPSALAVCSACEHGLDAKLLAVRRSIAGPVGHAISSALQQAWLDRFGKRANSPLHLLLGGRHRDSVPCYANINRGTTTRLPEQFAERAERAVSAGYRMVKLAPFDGMPSPQSGRQITPRERTDLFESAFQRITAVSERIAARASIAVDCHSRLSFDEAREAIDRLAQLGVHWLEEPVVESVDRLCDIAGLRALANARGMLLCGAENASSPKAMAVFTRADCYDVIMPDIVLAGGPLQALQMAQLADIDNTRVSLHNPCGPIMDVFSAQLASVLPDLHSLERQYDESPLYHEIIESDHDFRSGEYHLANVGGAGCRLNCEHPQLEQVARYRLTLP